MTPSPQVYARVGGFLYLIIIALGLFAEVAVRSRLFVAGDPAATAANITAGEQLWRTGIAAHLFYLTCGVGVALVFYVLLRPVNREIALLAVFFNLVSIAVESVSNLHLLATLFPITGGDYLQGLDPGYLNALAYFSIRTQAHGFGVSLIFFGCVCLVVGWLVYRSGYLPRILGVLMQLAGVCYLVNSFALILSPPFAARLFPFILLPPLIGESALCLWFLIRGVDVEKYRARAGAGAVG